MVRAMPVLWRQPDESFGKFVRRLLVENDMKDKDLREAAGISKNALSTILNGSPPRWESAEAIMRVLNVKMVQWGAGAPAEEGNLTAMIREAVEEYFAGGGGDPKRWIELKRLSVRPGTLHDYRVKLKLYVLHEKHGLGEVPLARLSKPAIEDWVLALRKRRPKLSASTLKAILRVLGGLI